MSVGCHVCNCEIIGPHTPIVLDVGHGNMVGTLAVPVCETCKDKMDNAKAGSSVVAGDIKLTKENALVALVSGRRWWSKIAIAITIALIAAVIGGLLLWSGDSDTQCNPTGLSPNVPDLDTLIQGVLQHQQLPLENPNLLIRVISDLRRLTPEGLELLIQELPRVKNRIHSRLSLEAVGSLIQELSEQRRLLLGSGSNSELSVQRRLLPGSGSNSELSVQRRLFPGSGSNSKELCRCSSELCWCGCKILPEVVKFEKAVGSLIQELPEQRRLLMGSGSNSVSNIPSTEIIKNSELGILFKNIWSSSHSIEDFRESPHDYCVNISALQSGYINLTPRES